MHVTLDLHEEGLFRLSGDQRRVQRFRTLIELGYFPDSDDPHTLCAVCKAFLRELPEPPIPSFLDATCVAFLNKYEDEPAVQLAKVRELLAVFPRENLAMVALLLRMFERIVAHADENKMTVKNISIVMQPTLRYRTPLACFWRARAALLAPLLLAPLLLAHVALLCRLLARRRTP